MDLGNNKYKQFAKVEFWIATIILTIIVLSLIGEAIDDAILKDLWSSPAVAHLLNYYLWELFQILALYGSYLLLNFWVAPNLIRKHNIAWNVTYLTGTCILLGVIFGSIDTSFVPLFTLAVYSLIKYTTLYIWNNARTIRERFGFLAPGVLLAIPLWVTSIFFLGIAEVHYVEIITWSTIVLAGIAMYSYSFLILIPRTQHKANPLFSYLLIFVGILAVAEIFILIVFSVLQVNGNLPLMVLVANSFFQILFVAPLSWVAYKKSQRTDERILTLEKELGQSSANLDFLKSQINPHFLFNALNTLYGTAIQENAMRTGEGIQKLGDMMRFMLQENIKDKIPLTREVEYLNNYIELQKLRTDLSPSIVITSEIQLAEHTFSIGPMLLIPFVENAFKHGISFREPSFIKIRLSIIDKVLYFDVSNSVYHKSDNDPEKDKGGIGLTNVKQRLEVLYKDRHELIIRNSVKEFFIHLTIQLS